MTRCVTLLIAALLLPFPAQSDPLQELEHYFFSVSSLEGRFIQETRDEDGRLLERSEGSLALQRPNRFHWHYEEPFEQDLVADGERLWVYDRDLEQISVRPLDDVLGSGPALMLSGEFTALEEHFRLRVEDGWIQLEPREEGWEVSGIRLQMEDGLPRRVLVEDGLGQINELQLEDLRQNVGFPRDRFHFRIPEGVDVIGDTGEWD
ncbi:MAG: outer membrane lipoprotein chaperone LolA [Ectothiorhodospiraceae bacterium]|nr:outer membrane lipoprotein chaperone LolA [Ectothiorhodospiraceae bacterium]